MQNIFLKTHVLSLGGSLIIPEDVDHEFIKKFREIILKRVEKRNRFIIICGGGGLNRKYNAAAIEIRNMKNDELDWIGIHATRYNARFMKILFAKTAYDEIAIDPHKKFKTDKPIIIGAGYKPGWSSDYDAVYLAKTYGAKALANLSNIDYVYDKDPKLFPDATPIKTIDWKNFRKLVGNKWLPRMNKPFDPIASREAQKLKLTVSIISGKNYENLENYLDGKDFTGTVIS